jgi:hypothetical protein
MMAHSVVTKVLFKTGTEAPASLPDIMFSAIYTCELIYTTAVILISYVGVLWGGSKFNLHIEQQDSQSQWPCIVRQGSAASRLLGLWVWILPVAWTSVSCECCGLSGKRSKCWADHLFSWVLPSMVCQSVIMKPQRWGGPGPQEAVGPWKK